MAEDLLTFRHQVVLETRDVGPRPGAPDVSASRLFGTKPLNTPRRFGTKTFRHQNISTQDGWMILHISVTCFILEDFSKYILFLT